MQCPGGSILTFEPAEPDADGDEGEGDSAATPSTPPGGSRLLRPPSPTQRRSRQSCCERSRTDRSFDRRLGNWRARGDDANHSHRTADANCKVTLDVVGKPRPMPVRAETPARQALELGYNACRGLAIDPEISSSATFWESPGALMRRGAGSTNDRHTPTVRRDPLDRSVAGHCPIARVGLGLRLFVRRGALVGLIMRIDPDARTTGRFARIFA